MTTEVSYLTQLKGLENKPIWVLTVGDIAERLNEQTQLRLSEQRHCVVADNARDVIWSMSPMGEITCINELRSPLSEISALTELLLHSQIDAQQRAWLSRSQDAARLLMGMICDLLDLSKLDSGQLVLARQNFQFNAVLQQVESMAVCSARMWKKTLYVCSSP